MVNRYSDVMCTSGMTGAPEDRIQTRGQYLTLPKFLSSQEHTKVVFNIFNWLLYHFFLGMEDVLNYKKKAGLPTGVLIAHDEF